MSKIKAVLLALAVLASLTSGLSTELLRDIAGYQEVKTESKTLK
jgi:hypothetical protein